ncbi:DNA-binding protein [Humidesulfovibrio idahonensis]
METIMDVHAGICIKGARAICEAVGENPKQIVRLVAEMGLPAWRRNGSGSWRALPEDLKRWVLAQRNQHLPETLPSCVPLQH